MELSQVLGFQARIMAGSGELEKGEEFCLRALELDDLNPQLCYLLGCIRQEQGKLEEARSALKQAIYLNPDFALAHFQLGLVYQREKFLLQGEKCFLNTLATLGKLPPDHLLEREGWTAGRLREILKLLLKERCDLER